MWYPNLHKLYGINYESHNRIVGENDWTKVRHKTNISKNPFGFMPEKSTIKTICIYRRLIDKFERRKDVYIVFIVMEKA